MPHLEDLWHEKRQRRIDRILTERFEATPPETREDVHERVKAVVRDKPQAPAREAGRDRAGFGPVPSETSYTSALGARMGRGFSITNTGVTGLARGRPLGPLAQRVRNANPGIKDANKRLWRKVRKSRPKAISEKLWHYLELHYGHYYKPWEIAEQLKPRVKERSVSMALSRARKLAAEHDIHFQ